MPVLIAVGAILVVLLIGWLATTKGKPPSIDNDVPKLREARERNNRKLRKPIYYTYRK